MNANTPILLFTLYIVDSVVVASLHILLMLFSSFPFIFISQYLTLASYASFFYNRLVLYCISYSLINSTTAHLSSIKTHKTLKIRCLDVINCDFGLWKREL